MGLVALFLAASMAAGAALALRHRRGRRSVSLSPVLDPMPAGVKHLASTVSDLSDLGFHLRGARGGFRDRKPRLGTLLAGSDLRPRRSSHRELRPAAPCRLPGSS